MTNPETLAGVEDVDLHGTTVLVTGGTSGVGRETALALARLGATVHVHGRDADRGVDVREQLRDRHSPSTFFRADFASRAAVRDLADEVREHVDDLDVLVNNAGAHFETGQHAWDGVEATFAVNHLAPFVLTHDLLPALADDARIVTTASAVHRRADPEDFADVASVEDYDGLAAYARSKLANVLFTASLARRLDGPTANCFHPGFVPGSGLWRNASLPVRAGVRLLDVLPQRLTGWFTDTPATAARTAVYLAAAPEAADTTGEYFADCEPEPPAPAAEDRDLQREVWDLSEDCAGLAWD